LREATEMTMAPEREVRKVLTDALLIALDRAKKRFTTRKELQDYTSILEERWMSRAEELARTFNFRNSLAL
jgi:hypothetical protein